MSRIPDLEVLPAIPLDEEGAVFDSPWEAKVFAVIVSLHQQGYFEWSEWATTISDEIALDKGRERETPYYELWLRAAERIITSKGLCTADDLREVTDTVIAEQTHDHTHAP